jgi:hypothetical protein
MAYVWIQWSSVRFQQCITILSTSVDVFMYLFTNLSLFMKENRWKYISMSVTMHTDNRTEHSTKHYLLQWMAWILQLPTMCIDVYTQICSATWTHQTYFRGGCRWVYNKESHDISLIRMSCSQNKVNYNDLTWY